MSYQVRHSQHGIYQGAFWGLGFWYPTSNAPEQGFYEFTTQADAQELIDFLCSSQCARPMNRADLTIEPFDREQSELLQAESVTTA
jgi:hypothetical protein